jgi:hypothetical protein
MTSLRVAFPPANSNNRRDPVGAVLLIGSVLSVVAVVGLGAIGIATVRVVESHRPVTAMPSSPPGIVAEAPGRAKASDPSPTAAPAVHTSAPSIVRPINQTSVRAQFAAWWSAAHPGPKPHVHHPQRRHSGAAVGGGFPELLQIYAPTPRAISGCPPSICRSVQ